MVRVSTMGFLLIAASILLILHPSYFALYVWMVGGSILIGAALIVLGSELEALRGEVEDTGREVRRLRKKLREASE